MDSKSALEGFALRYVVAGFRERFLHEAMKQPGKLHARIWHNIQEVMPASLARPDSAFSGEGPCFVLDGPRGFRATTWGALRCQIGLGEGLLVVGIEGCQFYAETEAVRGGPSVVCGMAANNSSKPMPLRGTA